MLYQKSHRSRKGKWSFILKVRVQSSSSFSSLCRSMVILPSLSMSTITDLTKLLLSWTERLNKSAIISPRFDVGVKEIESWTARLLSWEMKLTCCHDYGHLTEEIRAKHVKLHVASGGAYIEKSVRKVRDALRRINVSMNKAGVTGPKIPCNASEVMLRRRFEEQADLQHSIEVHRRRLRSLQLPNLKHNMAHHHHNRSLSIGSPGSLPSHLLINQNGVLPPHLVFNQNATLGSPVSYVPSMAAEERSKDDLPAVCAENCDSNNSEDLTLKTEGFDHHDLCESCVDENLFAGDSTNSTEASITNSTEASITNCSKASQSNA